jgi:hypothetical protein
MNINLIHASTFSIRAFTGGVFPDTAPNENLLAALGSRKRGDISLAGGWLLYRAIRCVVRMIN